MIRFFKYSIALCASILFCTVEVLAQHRNDSVPETSDLNWNSLPRWPIRPFDDDSCRENAGDLFEPGGRVARGSEIGKCWDTKKYRPVITLRDADLDTYQLPRLQDYVYVANVGDVNSWNVAAIPVKSIRSINYLIEEVNIAGMGFGHSLLRVFFDQPVYLRQQFPLGSGSVTQTNELIFSMHANGARGVPYLPVTIENNISWNVLWSIYTLKNKIADAILDWNHPVRQIPLTLTPAQSEKVILKFIQHGESYGYSRQYNIITQNCATELLFNFAKAIGTRAPDKQLLNSDGLTILSSLLTRGWGGTTGDIIPSQVLEALIERGLADPKNPEIPNLETEPAVLREIENLKKNQP